MTNVETDKEETFLCIFLGGKKKARSISSSEKNFTEKNFFSYYSGASQMFVFKKKTQTAANPFILFSLSPKRGKM